MTVDRPVGASPCGRRQEVQEISRCDANACEERSAGPGNYLDCRAYVCMEAEKSDPEAPYQTVSQPLF
jgi:hypothetical protein